MNEESPCSCSCPGWCERFGLQQGVRAHQLCQTSSTYRRAWFQRKNQLSLVDTSQVTTSTTHHNVPSSTQSKVPCLHLGLPTNEKVNCPTCRGNIRLTLFECSIYGKCTPGKTVSEYQCCVGCRSYIPKSELVQLTMKEVTSSLAKPTRNLTPTKHLRWSYGVTTVPSRKKDLLPRTLKSLAQAGFDKPHLFVDGAWGVDYVPLGLPTTSRCVPARIHGNWILSLYELYILEPEVDRYAIFQDDIVSVAGLRHYLDVCPYPKQGYLNLYSFRDNESIIAGKGTGWYEASQLQSGNGQTGRGALALVFSHEAVLTLLSSEHMLKRPLDPSRGWKAVDGGIVTAMNKAGWKEYIHNPSLVQHIGIQSTKETKTWCTFANTFPGEELDARSWLTLSTVAQPVQESPT